MVVSRGVWRVWGGWLAAISRMTPGHYDFISHHMSATRFTCFTVLAGSVCLHGLAYGEKDFKVPSHVMELLSNYCTDCHEDGTEKGDIRLDNLEELPLQGRLDLMNRALEQVYLK